MRGRFAIFGDLNQSLEKDGIGAWAELPEVISEARNAGIFELKINYRSTKPIIDLANAILKPYTKKYLPQSINRKGDEPQISYVDSADKLFDAFDKSISADIKALDKSIGVICYDDDCLSKAQKLLSEKTIPNEQFITLDSTVKVHYIPKGIYLMRFEDCKGLEFSKVYILGLNLEKIKDFSHAREAFVAVTRAMNELTVYGIKN
jgi:DNA helicase IV